jgi:SAM-dependent methyltransferase
MERVLSSVSRMDRLYNDPALARFYDWDCPWTADHDWFASLVRGSVLDLGCGTGMFAATLAARGHRVTGVDPARAMLDIARAREDGGRVTWVKADARMLRLGRRFDTVLMIGHAFQTLLTRDDRAAVLATIARHLNPGGRFFLDSRNPEAREWETWGEADTREIRSHPEFGMVERWNAAEWDAARAVVSYETHYRLPGGEIFSARSDIAFPPLDELEQMMTASGLAVEYWAGDPRGGPLRAGCPDFVPVGGLAPRR